MNESFYSRVIKNWLCIPVGRMYDLLTFLAIEKVEPPQTENDVHVAVKLQTIRAPSAPPVEQANTLYPNLKNERTIS